MPADPRPLSANGRPLSGLAALLGVVMAGPGPDPFTSPEGPQLVRGVTHDSRRVQPGDLYAALPGGHHHGAQFCQQAAAAGAGHDHAEQRGEPGQRAPVRAKWTRRHGPRLPLITVQ